MLCIIHPMWTSEGSKGASIGKSQKASRTGSRLFSRVPFLTFGAENSWLVKGLGVPSESVQDTPRYQILSTKEINYHGGMG